MKKKTIRPQQIQKQRWGLIGALVLLAIDLVFFWIRLVYFCDQTPNGCSEGLLAGAVLHAPMTFILAYPFEVIYMMSGHDLLNSIFAQYALVGFAGIIQYGLIGYVLGAAACTIHPKLQKMNRTQKLLIITVLASLILLGVELYKQYEQLEFLPPAQETTHLFVATQKEDRSVTVTFYDLESQKGTQTQTFTPDDVLSATSAQSWGANDAVQYDSETNQIFYKTDGHGGMEGGCTNKDGTCADRIYKLEADGSQKLLYQGGGSISHWIVDPANTAILLIESGKEWQIFTSISEEDGHALFTVPYEFAEQQSAADLRVTEDGAFTYQAAVAHTQGVGDILYLEKFNNQNGVYEERGIYTGLWIEPMTAVSPDGQYLAFYGNSWEDQKLFLYNIENKTTTEIPFEGEISNFTLLWSGDSQKLIVNRKDGIAYYDAAKKTFFNTYKDGYVFGWAPALHFFAFQGMNDLKIYNTDSQEAMETLVRFDHPSLVEGLEFF